MCYSIIVRLYPCFALCLSALSLACRPKAVPIEPAPEAAQAPEDEGEGDASELGEVVEDGASAGAEVHFPAADGVEVFADLHRAEAGVDAPLIILFHQAGGSARGEYGPIIPRLVATGYHVLAIDQRSGGDRFELPNRTAAGVEAEVGYCDAYPDLEAALVYAASTDLSGPRVVWGSSYSAGLVFKLGAEHAAEIAAVLGFSPASGEPMAACNPADALPGLEAPTLALRPSKEAENEAVQAQIEIFKAAGVEVYIADPGTHGSSMLVPERAGGDTEPTWEVVLAFLARVGG